MGTVIRPEISGKNKYWISKHRHYELKHFCLQYPLWKKEYALCESPGARSSTAERIPSTNIPGDPTANAAMKKLQYAEKIKIIERAAIEADEDLWPYILKGVTEGHSYTYLKSRLNIPCSKDTYYDRYRRFFWLLSNFRD